jgi:hypothetical protein
MRKTVVFAMLWGNMCGRLWSRCSVPISLCTSEVVGMSSRQVFVYQSISRHTIVIYLVSERPMPKFIGLFFPSPTLGRPCRIDPHSYPSRDPIHRSLQVPHCLINTSVLGQRLITHGATQW